MGFLNIDQLKFRSIRECKRKLNLFKSSRKSACLNTTSKEKIKELCNYVCTLIEEKAQRRERYRQTSI